MAEKKFILSNRQRRAIEVLLSRESISVKDIGPQIGALNPRQIIMELRRQGFSEIIITRRFTVYDRDGKRCLPGEYFIPTELKPDANKALEEYTALQSLNHKADSGNCNNDSNKEEDNDSTE